MYDFFKHKFFRPARVSVSTAAPVLDPAEVARKLERGRLLHDMREDTKEQRKIAWLKSLRPRITKGKSGFWWCVSEHNLPDGRRGYNRVGSGRTPREAYDAWMEY